MKEVIIIGAGFSGIAAAKKLYEAKIPFIVLEARERLGGRVFTTQIKENLYLDFGGQWIGPSQDRMYALCEEFGIGYYETYNQGFNLLDLNQKVKKFKGLIPKMDIVSLINLDYVLKKLEKLAKSISLNNPWSHPKAMEFDSISLGAFVATNCKTSTCKKVVDLALETVFAAELNEVSLLHALFYIKSGRDLNTLINIKNGAQLHRIVGGMQTIIEKMAAPFKERIYFNHAVEKITQENETYQVSGKDFSYATRRIIMAIPPPLAAKIEFQPMLSSEKRQVMDRIAMGQVGKCFMVYDKPFWRDSGFSGQAFADQHSPFQSMFDTSPRNSDYGIILGFTIGQRARNYFTKTKEDRKAIMLEKLVEYFGTAAQNPLLYEDFTMTDEAWSRGCYAGIYPTGTWTGFQDSYAQTEGQIYWAGTEASKVWFGYIEGAVRSGEKAAQEIIDGIKN
ncbi:flavin monoamine oxidase family protein [Cecembia rubra]|uniref:Monoamine oxidase n=1 Tax=Cecembia rubra TaxID=1485585 RepID=A0A2P8EAG0_9BACT|nr:FAD-dependent oxidoreductase [Cecembia rubra]PSL06452.1 monoamine oxidase [Cecembia rubra]